VATVDGDDAAMTPRKTAGRLIGAFKTVSAKRINRLRGTPAAGVWQRNFWERVVRDDAEMDRFRAYIRNNVINWASDGLYDGVGAVREPPLQDFP
jgi:putative transposase